MYFLLGSLSYGMAEAKSWSRAFGLLSGWRFGK